MAKRYYWLKMKEDFFNQKEIKKIRRVAGGDTYTIIYLKLMLLSLKNEGKLFFDGIEESIAEEIALEIDEDSTNVQTVLGLLFSMHIIEEIPEGVEIANIKHYIGSEGASAERARKSRANKRLEESKALQSNTQVTKCNTEIEIDIELEKEKEIDKELNKEKDKELKKTITSVLNSYAPSGGELRNALNEFKEMRSKMKKPLTVRALEMALNELDKLSCGDEMTKIAIVDQSLEHGWQKFYELKVKNTQYSSRQQKSIQEGADDLANYIDMMNGGSDIEQ